MQVATKDHHSRHLVGNLVPLSEALLGVLLPLWVEIVGTDTSLDDNVGACGGERGGGWTTKNTRCSELSRG